MKKVFSVKKDFIDTRFDRWFRRNISNVPQSLIEKSLRKGKIKINNKKSKSSYKLKENDLIYIYNLNFSPKKTEVDKKKYKATNKDLSSTSKIFIEKLSVVPS